MMGRMIEWVLWVRGCDSIVRWLFVGGVEEGGVKDVFAWSFMSGWKRKINRRGGGCARGREGREGGRGVVLWF